MCVCVCVLVRERESMSVRENDRLNMCVREGKHMRERMCVCVQEREREGRRVTTPFFPVEQLGF